MSDASFLLRLAALTLASILVVVVIAMLVGLFLPQVDNKAVFALLAPAFQTIVGAFVGLISGVTIANRELDRKTPPVVTSSQNRSMDEGPSQAELHNG